MKNQIIKKGMPGTRIEINKKNLIHNITVFKSILRKDTKIIAVLKANAYGHGQNIIAPLLERHVALFAVNSVSELEALRKISKKKTLVLGYISDLDISKAVKLGCVISIFSIDHLKKLGELLKKIKKTQEINIAVDAYLGREGILAEDLPEFMAELLKYKQIKVRGIYAHFANIEDTTDFSHAEKQNAKYEEVLKNIKKLGIKNLETHISATSGLLVYENDLNIGMQNSDHHTYVRIGIGLYGLWPAEHLEVMYENKKSKNKNRSYDLLPVLTYKTHVAQVKNLLKGNSVGYGLTFVAPHDMKTAVIPQGYADGIDRGLSNCGQVLIHGQRCNILGRVMMNMCVVDVSHIANIAPEDEVVILGKQGNEEITAEEIGAKIGTINYEIITRLSPLLPRIIT